jgi:hypothetical protein
METIRFVITWKLILLLEIKKKERERNSVLPFLAFLLPRHFNVLLFEYLLLACVDMPLALFVEVP